MTGPRLAYIPEYQRIRVTKMLREGFTNQEIKDALLVSYGFVSRLRQELGLSRGNVEQHKIRAQN